MAERGALHGHVRSLLAEHLHVVIFDCRNIGQSERRDEPYTIGDETSDIYAVMSAPTAFTISCATSRPS